MNVLVGTSGWQYADWRGDFYPTEIPQRRWLEFYADHFLTVEVNNTFYRLPKQEVFADWARRVPADFCIALKMSRYLSHVKRLQAPREPIDRFLRHAAPLGRAAGPTLLQLPPNLPLDGDRLRGFLRLWPADHRLAIEFRHDSWYHPTVENLLTEHQVALCLTDRRGRSLQPLWRTAPWTYVRFHEGTNRNRYTRAILARWVGELESRWGGHADVYVYFNNDVGGAAIRDARLFAELADVALPSPD